MLRTGGLLVQECTLTNRCYLVLENSLDLLEQVPLNLCFLHEDASSLVLLADELDQAFELNSSVAFAFGS